MGRSESVIEKLLRFPEIVDFHYDNRDWGVEEIDNGLFMEGSERLCIPRVKKMKSFLEIPYVEDVFGADGKKRDI